jgi:hypothetical protein
MKARSEFPEYRSPVTCPDALIAVVMAVTQPDGTGMGVLPLALPINNAEAVSAAL